jgi:hypothetical protein
MTGANIHDSHQHLRPAPTLRQPPTFTTLCHIYDRRQHSRQPQTFTTATNIHDSHQHLRPAPTLRQPPTCTTLCHIYDRRQHSHQPLQIPSVRHHLRPCDAIYSRATTTTKGRQLGYRQTKRKVGLDILQLQSQKSHEVWEKRGGRGSWDGDRVWCVCQRGSTILGRDERGGNRAKQRASDQASGQASKTTGQRPSQRSSEENNKSEINSKTREEQKEQAKEKERERERDVGEHLVGLGCHEWRDAHDVCSGVAQCV